MLYDDNDTIRRDEYTFVYFIDAVTVFSFSLVLLLPSPQLSIIGIPAKVVLHLLPHRCASKGRSPSSSRLYKARLPQHLWRYYHTGLVTSVVRIVVGRCAHTWRTDGAARQFDCCGLFSSTAWSSKQLRTRERSSLSSRQRTKIRQVGLVISCRIGRSDMVAAANMRKDRMVLEAPLSPAHMRSGV